MQRYNVLVPLLLLALSLAGCSKKGTTGDATGDTDTPDGADATDTVIPPDVNTDVPTDGTDIPDIPEEPGICDGHEGTIFCDGTVAITCSADGDVVSEEECDDGMAGTCEDGVGCVAPSYDREIDIAAMYSDDTVEDSVGVMLVDGSGDVDSEDFGTSKYRMRPVTLSLTWGFTEGDITLDVSTSELQLFQTDGTAITTPATYTVADLPLDFLVNATTTTDGTITATFTPPWTTLTPVDDVVRVRAVRVAGLAGRPLAGYPYFEFVDAFNDDETVSAALDPNRFPDRESFGYDVYVVAHRTPAEWAADNSLTDVSGGTESHTPVAGSIADNTTSAWTSGLVAGDMVGIPYDVVFDYGGDGTLDPGDMIDGLYSDRAGLYVVKDLNTDGPYSVVSTSYTGGYWYTQKTYYPSNIATLGRVPLVVISHGNGHVYYWYDYLGEHLASHGYVVMSHRNDTRPGIITASTTTLTNTDFFLGNLDAIDGGALDGHIDTRRIAWIGHSRGGEGVVYAYDRLRDGDFRPTNYTTTDIVLISSIAPTVFYSVDRSNPHDVDYHLLYGASDGDVHGGPDCVQCQCFRISNAAAGHVQVNYVQGAGHNDFNCCGFDDATGPDLIGRSEAQRVAKSYYLALVEHYLQGNIPALEYFTRMYDGFHPSAIAGHVVLANTYRDALADGNFFLDDFQTSTSTTLASSGGTVAFDVLNVREGRLDDGNDFLTWSTSDAMNGMTQAEDSNDLKRGVVFDWSSSSYWEVQVPSGEEDFTQHTYLQFRACQGTRHPNTVALDAPLDFTVTLEDGSGATSSINFGEYGGITNTYKRTGKGTGAGWANEFSTVRIRLSDFETDGPVIDLSDIQVVRFEFGGAHGSDLGRIGLDDVELVP